MAEAVVFNLASKILSAVASPALQKAYEKGVSIWEARDELAKLQVSVETIHAVLLDAERKQESSVAIRNWIKRLKSVLYNAEDLFDEFATEDLIKQQMKEGKEKVSLKKKVYVSCFKFNPIVSRNSIAKKVKAIRVRLDDISKDMAQFQFVRCLDERPIFSTGREKYTARCSIDAKLVIGRDEDKKAILDMLISESLGISTLDAPPIIAIDGIGGMGKTTLAHLIYNDEIVSKCFDKRWFACISNTSDETEVLRKIYQAVCGGSYNDLSLIDLEQKIKESINGKKYLLVLDDVWEDNRGRWENRKSLLHSGANGSKIIVTTRLPAVGIAMGAVRAHNLKGLSDDDSWYLFKSLAFAPGYENDPRRESLGRELLQKCRGLPLAIWCMGSLLHNKTIREWEEIEKVGLPTLREEYTNEIMCVLKLSYDHLPSNYKQCFTYCCLFPKGYRYIREELIYQWIAQGYIDLNEEESCFMHLLRMGFFQEEEEDEFGATKSCKMHDIMHDLALQLMGEEGEFGTSLNVKSSTRHVSLIVDGDEGGSWDIPPSLFNVKSIRSCMLRRLSYKHSQPNLNHLCSNFKWLRTLTLSHLGIKHIPPSIGELKLVKYLDLSWNNFEELPDSITNLVNLLVLNLDGCLNIKVWPRNFKNLIKLRFLKLSKGISSMPEGIAGMDNLQYLSNFWVENWSKVDRLNKLLEHLRGSLSIMFDSEMEVEHEGRWQLPAIRSLQDIEISSYTGHEIGGWENSESENKLEHLHLESFKNVKYLSSMSCLPVLKFLRLEDLPELEFLEEEEELNNDNPAASQKLFPSLKRLELDDLPKLKGWRGKVAAEATPTSPKSGFSGKALASLEYLHIRRCSSLTSLHLASTRLRKIAVENCDNLKSIELDQSQSIRSLNIRYCRQLESLHIEALALAEMEEIEILGCPDLKLLNTQDKSLSVLRSEDSVLLERSPSLLLTSSLKNINISNCKWEISLRCLELTSLESCTLSDIYGLQSLHIPSPHLLSIYLENCVGLTSVEVEAPTKITIFGCSELKKFCVAHPVAVQSLSIYAPSSVDWGSISNLTECNRLATIYLCDVDGGFVERLLSSPASSSSSSCPSEKEMSIFKSTGSLTVALKSLERLTISCARGLKSLIIKSPHLENIRISKCNELTSVELESPSLPHHPKDSIISLLYCSRLKNVRVSRPIGLDNLTIVECPELSLNTGVDWDALTDLSELRLNPLPSPEELPQCLLQRRDLCRFRIRKAIDLLSFIRPQTSSSQAHTATHHNNG